jgi:penicillin amidase
LFVAQIPSRSLAGRAQAALAVTQGKLKAPGLEQPVSVLRDRWGVAHIYAQSQHDLFFAQGFVAAQDRLFQMELWKRSGEGRLAEILGPSALLRDVNARLLRYRGNMKLEYESYSPDTESILRAFTDGINTYIRGLAAPGSPGLPLEFQLAGFRPQLWQPEDCLNRMAAFSMTGNAFSELLHAQVVAKIGVHRASQLLDLDPKVMLDPAPGADLTGLSPALLKHLVGSDVRIEFAGQNTEGSNNWTVAGKLTISGKPILANDPHRVIAVPSLRYIVHLVGPGWNVIGVGEPGLPGVAAGHNQHIAWGFTVFGIDQQDLYIEELNPSDLLQYKTERGWERMRVERESFGIKDGPNVEVTLKFTRHGPVLWEDGKRALALRWVGGEPGTAGYLGSLAVDRAENWAQFESAMERWKVPSENIVYADHEGNIGEHSIGLAPLRKNWTGLLPMPGAAGYEWAGFVPMSDLPKHFNPAQAFIATANQKMIPEGFRYPIGYEWSAPYRFHRIEQLLLQSTNGAHKLDVTEMEKLQTDVVSLPARELLEILKSAGVQNSTEARRLLLTWNGSLSADSAAGALYEVWLRRLRRTVAEKVAPPDVAPLLGAWSLTLLMKHLSAPSVAVFGEHPVEARDRLLDETLQQAWQEMKQIQGQEASRWAWGRLHTMRFRHPLDLVAGSADLLDLGPVSRPGDGTTINATGFGDETFEQADGASYREILDLNDWDHSAAINTPGQSGQPGSMHYSDLLSLWSEEKYFPLVYSRSAVEREATERLLLEP